MYCNTISSELPVIEETFAKMVDCIYDIQIARKQGGFNCKDSQHVQNVHQKTKLLHRFIDRKAFSLANSHRYQLHRMVIDLDLFFCGKPASGALGEQLINAQYYEDFGRDAQILSFTTSYLEDEILLAERLGYDEEDIIYPDQNASYDDEDLMNMGFREQNAAFELDGFIVGTDLVVRALKDTFMDMFGDILEHDTNA